AELEIGLVDVGDEAPGQPREGAGLDAVEVLRRPVRRDHQPAAGRDNLVHRVEEFFLGRFLAGEVLGVVDHQKMGAAYLLLELDGGAGGRAWPPAAPRAARGFRPQRRSWAPRRLLR